MKNSTASRGPTRGVAPPDAAGTLGTFGGVFTPSILTILGIILFLRVGYVVGAAGLPRALLIIALANAISLLTSISLAAIATNLRVKGGGDYYLISRTLGVEYGGALGVVLFLAQSVSVGFYVIGFGEALATIAGRSGTSFAQIVAALAVAALFVLAWLGADWATRFQFVVMAVLFSALVAFFVGGLARADAEQLRANLTAAGSVPFWALFAIFFPAVTGFTQGVSMSGDLEDPGRSLPRGTFAAVGLSFLVYLAVAVVFAAALPASVLASDYSAMRRVSGVAWLVDAGVIAATLSSAMASFLGAPRILQSLARDRVFPLLGPFAAGHGPTGNPRRGVMLSAVIAYGTVALGNLNTIAAVVSMFFLISYGLLNYATYVEARSKSPSFRPRFRFFHARLSLAGALGCLGAMLAIDPLAGAVAVVVLFALHHYVARSVTVERWADSERSHRMQRVRDDLHAIQADLAHPRDWRPVLLAFSDDPRRRERILRFASWLEGGSGFTTVVRVLRGEGPPVRRVRDEAEAELEGEIKKLGLSAFAKAVVARDVGGALPVLLQSHGLGRVRTNTVLLNWYDRHADEDRPGLRAYGQYLRLALRFGCNLVVLAAGSNDFAALERTPRSERRIDVWYRDNASGKLMLLLAYLTTRTEEWEEARIRVLAAPPRGAGREEALEGMRQMLSEVRIDAEPEVVDDLDPATVVGASSDSSIVFLPLRIEESGPTSALGAELDDLLGDLGITALVLAAEDIVLDSEPEAGRHAEIAEAADAAAKASKTAERAEKQAASATESVQEARERLAAGRAGPGSAEEVAALEAAVATAEQEAEEAKRRAARARAKADDARQQVAALTGEPEENGRSGEAGDGE